VVGRDAELPAGDPFHDVAVLHAAGITSDTALIQPASLPPSTAEGQPVAGCMLYHRIREAASAEVVNADEAAVALLPQAEASSCNDLVVRRRHLGDIRELSVGLGAALIAAVLNTLNTLNTLDGVEAADTGRQLELVTAPLGSSPIGGVHNVRIRRPQ
jgi:hypothetical protein